MDYHTEYALHTLLYLSNMAVNGDYETLLQTGISQHQTDRLLAMNTQELHEVARMSHTSLMSILLDKSVLDTVMDTCRRRIQQRDLIFKLLTAGASFPVMQHLFGLTRSDMTAYRKLKHIKDCSGRPNRPDEAKKQAIWNVWIQTQQNQLCLAEQLLAIHQATQVKISAIWPVIREWFKDKPKENN